MKAEHSNMRSITQLNKNYLMENTQYICALKHPSHVHMANIYQYLSNEFDHRKTYSMQKNLAFTITLIFNQANSCLVTTICIIVMNLHTVSD